MTAHHSRPATPDVTSEQKREKEVIKLIRKLRWIGMEDEAQRVLVSAGEIHPTDSVVAGPRDTD